METLDIILVSIASVIIIGIGLYITLQKKVEKSTGDGPVLRPEDDTQLPPTSSLS